MRDRVIAGLLLACGMNAASGRLHMRTLAQVEDTFTWVRMVDLESIPAVVQNSGKPLEGLELMVPEYQLKGSVNVTEPAEEGQSGSYALSPQQVSQLIQTVNYRVPEVPPGQANVTLVDGGLLLRGHSFIDSPSAQQSLRIPTVFDPFRAGRRFLIQSQGESVDSLPKPTTLHLQNVTLLVANGTYNQLQVSGMMDFFNLSRSSRLCLSDSSFVLQSCEGFENNFNIWCCSRSECNIEYRRSAIEDWGYGLNGTATELIQCYELVPPVVAALDEPDDRWKSVMIPLVVSAVCVALLVCCAGALLWRHRRQQSEAKVKEKEMQEQIGMYEDELQKHQEQSRNEQAELQKVKMQYKMLEMDLLANTGNSGDGDTFSSKANNGSKAVGTLTVLDADDEQSAKSIQKQLRSVLHAADERTPVSVQAEIGRGAFGVVYRGVWKNIQVAIKTVLFQASGDIHNDPVLREAMLALRIAHPNLVATYRANVRMLEDAALSGGGANPLQVTGDITPSYQLFLLQEFCDSGTLYDWLSRERMHPGNVPDKGVIVRCALDIARGVQHLHHAEIVHGDLKPQNIMLTTMTEAMRRESRTPSPPTFPYQAKLTDFGLSFQMDRNKSHLSNMRIGTPFYFAPEVQGKGYLSKAADLYSLGVLLWEMFHGMPPYAAENGHLVNNASFPRFDLRHREDAPFSYVVVALACLSESHERRPSIDDVVVVLEDLNECLNGVADGSMLMRNASIKRVTKGSSKAGFAAPPSLVKQASALPATQLPAAATPPFSPARKPAKPVANVSQTILQMLQRSGLHRDSDLRKRLDLTDATELEKLAGASMKQSQHRVLKDVRGGHGVANVHMNQQWMFDVLPPTSVEQTVKGTRPA